VQYLAIPPVEGLAREHGTDLHLNATVRAPMLYPVCSRAKTAPIPAVALLVWALHDLDGASGLDKRKSFVPLPEGWARSTVAGVLFRWREPSSVKAAGIRWFGSRSPASSSVRGAGSGRRHVLYDRRAQYFSKSFGQTTVSLDIRNSVGNVGSCFDNAPVESFNAALKVERVTRTVYPTREHARKDTCFIY
jgi:transposase InsO family protein